MNTNPSITIESETPTIAQIDGDKGFGQVVARRGITLAIDKARAQGLSAVTLKQTNHVGRLADYAEMAAAQGLLGMWVNAPTALNVAPWGGAARRLGTNPHAVAIPGPNGTVAMSHDFATSVVAEGKLKVKFNRGEKVAPGGILSGTGAAREGKGPVANGVLMLCIDPGRFLPAADFHAQVGALFGFVRSAPLAAGAEEILIPGDPEARTSRERRAGGVPIDDETWRQIKECAVEVGVDA